MSEPHRRHAAIAVKDKEHHSNGTHPEHFEAAAAFVAGRRQPAEGEQSCAESVVVRTLPTEAEAIAHDYAARLGAEDLSDPLTDFLAEVSAMPGIDGVALAAWGDRKAASYLSVYALTDRRRLNAQSGPESLRASVDRAYGRLDHAVRAKLFPLASGFSWVNTRGEDVRCVFSSFEAELKDAPLLSLTPTDEELVLLTFATPGEHP